MKPFRWSPEKNETLKAERGISFENIVVSIEAGGLLDILAHPNQAKYPRQRVLVVACDNYVFGAVCRRGRLFLSQDRNSEPQGNEGLFESR
jgi:uncharacterized DUF497 family protein